jgi:small-conductance mechanosensitive channel
MKKIVYLILLATGSILLWFLNFQYSNQYLYKGFTTLFALTVIYLIIKVGIEEIGTKGIRDSKTRYSFRKTISILFLFISIIILGMIWIENPEALFVAYGIIGAGIAISLQDVFKSFAGGVLIFINGVYRVGDRIEINGKIGDVIDIDIMNTTLLELRNWMSGDQATGRLLILPNSLALTEAVFNYTKDHNYIWDEIVLPLTFDSDWRSASKTILELIKKETATIMVDANKSISSLEQKYYLAKKVSEPAIFIKITDNWIEMYIRYITEVRERRVMKNKIHRLILNEIEKSPNIKLASATFDIVGFPEIKLVQES